MKNGVFLTSSFNNTHPSFWGFRLLLLAMVLTLTLGTVGCERSGQRVKMSKPPNPLVTQKQQYAQGDSLAEHPKQLVQSAQLSVADAVSILGGFTYAAHTTYQYQKGTNRLVLKTEYLLEQRKDGAFRVKVTNDKDKGYEVRWINNTLLQRFRHRPFRLISREIGIAHRWQRRGFGRWRAIVGLFGTHLSLSRAGSDQMLQRTVIKYRVTYRDSPRTLPLPTEGTAWDGPVPNKTRGFAAKHKRNILAANGAIWVDQKSGLVVKVNFAGRYSIGKGKQKTVATVKMRSSFTSLGDPDIKIPTKIVIIKREPEPKNPFVGSKTPPYMKPPPSSKKKKKRLRRR